MSESKHTPGPHYAIEYSGFWAIRSEPYYDAGIDLLDEEECPEAGGNAFLYASAPSLLSELEQLRKENANLSLQVHGISEGAEQWQQEYDNCRAILKRLVELKLVKDKEGKTEEYQRRQPLAWKMAMEFLNQYQHQ